jgi:isoamylase
VTLLIERRLVRDVEAEYQGATLNQLLHEANFGWHGVKLGQPDWGNYSHSLALSAEMRKEKIHFHFILNAYWEPLDFELPAVGNGNEDPWRRWIDTSLDSPNDIVEWRTSPPIPERTYRAGPRSVAVLWARLGGVASPTL